MDKLPPGLTTGRHPATDLKTLYKERAQDGCYEDFNRWQCNTELSGSKLGCIIPFRSPKSTNRPSLLVKGKRILLSHLAKYAVHGVTVYDHPSVVDNTRQANEIDLSHLCHVGDCINADHLHFEPTEVNHARTLCRTKGACLKHGEYPNCLFS